MQIEVNNHRGVIMKTKILMVQRKENQFVLTLKKYK